MGGAPMTTVPFQTCSDSFKVPSVGKNGAFSSAKTSSTRLPHGQCPRRLTGSTVEKEADKAANTATLLGGGSQHAVAMVPRLSMCPSRAAVPENTPYRRIWRVFEENEACLRPSDVFRTRKTGDGEEQSERASREECDHSHTAITVLPYFVTQSLMKPWFWIILLFLGPMISSVSYQWYTFISVNAHGDPHKRDNHSARFRACSAYARQIRNRGKEEKKQRLVEKKATANLLGKITNLVTTRSQPHKRGTKYIVPCHSHPDLIILVQGRDLLFLVILVPIQSWALLSSCTEFLVGGAQKATLKKTDARVQMVVETINVLRMVKMFGWEKEMNTWIADKREEELKKLWIRRLLNMTSGMLNDIQLSYDSHLHHAVLTIPQTVIAHQDLSVSKVFSSMGVFDLLRSQLWYAFSCISTAVNGKVSLDRLDDFLHNTELLDTFTSREDLEITAPNEPASNFIGFRDATSHGPATRLMAPLPHQAAGSSSKSRANFCLNRGSGKTSLLMALLGEMHLVPSSLLSWYNLPRSGGISYAAQESWVLNDTIRNNILFNSPMDEARYSKVLYQCCLERDLEVWDAGDETEVGEKGLTLSGGQKARVTLAWAIYANTEIILMDDVLAALDVHTAHWIVDKCLSGDLIKNRTVILVTHNVVMTSKIAEFVVSLGLDSRVHSQGSVSDALEQDEQLAKEVTKDQEILELAEKELDPTTALDNPPKKDGKLVIPEEIAIGHVSWKALSLYFKGMGGGGAYTIPF
ncbi:hypothetical protein B0H14DRAFT_3138599, partial [Mycena olivaceomarginata]